MTSKRAIDKIFAHDERITYASVTNNLTQRRDRESSDICGVYVCAAGMRDPISVTGFSKTLGAVIAEALQRFDQWSKEQDNATDESDNANGDTGPSDQ
jgi:hypothetical protein